ncbi:alkene reductase [Salisaeta longa]|uniref:alkene reductase n=1 Tax=Salisaeta longa TaxID=503170 RepID=UPI0003B512EB|nr:alkene reductase [Salisaeta longa]
MARTLITPYTLGALSLPNRVVMGPMTRNRATGTIPQPIMATYYRQRASAGLIVSEATQVTPMGQGYPNTPGIHSDEQVEAWQAITDAVHAAGGRIFLQLWHVGRISHPAYHDGKKPVAPSAIQPDGQAMTPSFEMAPFPTPRALNTEELPEIVEQFRQGAANAKRAGFDGVEVHGANGYLLDQFLQSATNARTDRYGGSPENRARLLLDVTEAVTEVWDSQRVGVRLSPAGGMNDISDDDPHTTFGYVGDALNAYDLAYVHVVEGAIDDDTNASDVVRAAYDGSLIVCGGLDRERGEALVQEGRADLAGYARCFLSNPDLPRRFLEEAPLNDWDRDTFYGGGAEGYIDYPTLDEANDAAPSTAAA